MKKIQLVKEILKEQDDLNPWEQEAHVKLIYNHQLGDAPPDICPAFIHSLKTITKGGPTGDMVLLNVTHLFAKGWRIIITGFNGPKYSWKYQMEDKENGTRCSVVEAVLLTWLTMKMWVTFTVLKLAVRN